MPDWTIESLRPWQREALTAWYDAGCVGICEAVTGTGKTHLGLEAVAQTVRRGGRATVLVPSVLLQRQWELRLEEFVGAAVIAKVGGNARGNPKTADVVLAVVNSAASNDLTDIPGMELLVADEVHRYGGEGWAVALRDGYDRRLGLTATLERSSDDGVAELLLPYFTSVVHHYGYDRATTEGVVAPFDLIFLGVDLDPEQRQEYESLGRRISSARKVLIRAGAKPATLHQQLGALRSMGGDVTKAVIAFENATRERRRLLAETPAKHDAVRSLSEFVRESDGSVVFTQSIETAEAAAHVLREEHLQVEAVSSALTHRRRQELIDGLFDRALDALAAPKILDEGVDVPDVNLGIVMGASSSRRQMIQRLGRIIRLKADGGRARFVVLFVIDSVEDPQSGSRQDFMDEVEDAASRVVLLPEWDEDDLSAVWAGSAPTWSSDMVGAPDDAAPDGALPAPVVVPPQPAGGTPERVAPRPGSAAPRCRRPQRRLPRPVLAAPTAEVLAVLDEIEQTRQLLELLRMEAATQRGPS